MKTVFTNTLAPDARWFNNIQNATWGTDGTKDGEYLPLTADEFETIPYLKLDESSVSGVSFLGGLLVSTPDSNFAPVSREYCINARESASLSVSAPGLWVNYSQGVLECPTRARLYKPTPKSTQITTAIGLDVYTWFVDFVPNKVAAEGISYTGNSFTISGVVSEPSIIDVGTYPTELGAPVSNLGLNRCETVWEKPGSVKVVLGQTNQRRYCVTLVV